ncbi:MAG: hypothetical protein FJY67_04480 [Calditrichaeota bacterium]|nr:hypothetical protein [Calditrichota bacterium]
MNVIPILSTVILVATIATFIVAITSYLIFRIKEKRRLASMAPAVSVEEMERRLREEAEREEHAKSGGGSVAGGSGQVVINVGSTQPAPPREVERQLITPIPIAMPMPYPVMTPPAMMPGYNPAPAYPQPVALPTVMQPPPAETPAPPASPPPALTSPQPVAAMPSGTLTPPSPSQVDETAAPQREASTGAGRSLSTAQSVFMKTFEGASADDAAEDDESEEPRGHLRRFTPGDPGSSPSSIRSGGRSDWK